MQTFLEEIRAAIEAETGIQSPKLETPRDLAMGDVAFPCFVLAKERKAAPPKIATPPVTLIWAEAPGLNSAPR